MQFSINTHRFIEIMLLQLYYILVAKSHYFFVCYWNSEVINSHLLLYFMIYSQSITINIRTILNNLTPFIISIISTFNILCLCASLYRCINSILRKRLAIINLIIKLLTNSLLKYTSVIYYIRTNIIIHTFITLLSK